MPEVRLLEDYVCDVEWYVAYPADPRFTYHSAGETYWATDEEARDLIAKGKAEAIYSATSPSPAQP